MLLVEDNLTNQEAALSMLRKMGVLATVVNHGKEALHLLGEQLYDLVPMDLRMP